MFDDLFTWSWANLSALSLLLAAGLWRQYTARRDGFLVLNKRDTTGQRVPPTFPYFFPLLGTLPITYLWKPRAFVLDRK